MAAWYLLLHFFGLAKGLMGRASVIIMDSRYGNSDISNQHHAGKSTKALSDIVLHSRATRANLETTIKLSKCMFLTFPCTDCFCLTLNDGSCSTEPYLSNSQVLPFGSLMYNNSQNQVVTHCRTFEIVVTNPCPTHDLAFSTSQKLCRYPFLGPPFQTPLQPRRPARQRSD